MPEATIRVRKLTRKDLCEGLGIANDWHELNSMMLNDPSGCMKYIRQKVSWLSEISDTFSYGPYTSQPVVISTSEISRRALTCYNSALLNLSDHRFSDALHEIHDYIYEFGKQLDQTLSTAEELLLVHWINLYFHITNKL